MYVLKLFSLLSLLGVFLTMDQVYAQEEWEPETFITGYLNTLAEFTDQKQHQEINKDIGVGLSEVGFLVSYKPKRNIELKTTLVWAHDVPDLQALLVEAHGTYTFSEMFKIGAGKFLSPLSPVNTYFYAPLNPSISLPMIVQNYNLTPQSISGIQVSGQFGNKLKINYNVTYGNYSTTPFLRKGIINLMGYEVLSSVPTVAGRSNEDSEFDLGGSARLSFELGPVSIGFNHFEGTRSTILHVDYLTFSVGDFASRRRVNGIDLHLNFLGDRLKFNTEIWKGSNKTIDDPTTFNVTIGEYVSESIDLSGFYAELMYKLGKFTPYIRYEDTRDNGRIYNIGDPTQPVNEMLIQTRGFQTEQWGTLLGGEAAISGATDLSFGIAYRPMYEILLKFQYRRILARHLQNDDYRPLSRWDDNRYNHLLFSAVFSL